MKHLLSISLALALYLAPVRAAEVWRELGINQFGFIFDLPLDFDITDSYGDDGSTGMVFKNPEGDTIIVWGIELDDADLLTQVEEQIRANEEEGWHFTHKQLDQRWAAYSGVKDGMIRYVKVITVCHNRAAFFLMDYPQDRKEYYDPIVTRMEKSMRPDCSF